MVTRNHTLRLFLLVAILAIVASCTSAENDTVDPANNLVLVTGITGTQGGGVADVLLEKGYKVRGLSRDAGSERSQAWAAKGVEMVTGNFDDHASVDAAVEGIDYLFLNITERATDNFVEDSIYTLEAAVAAGAKHVVFSSTITSNPDDNVPGRGGASKKDIEAYLRESSLPYSSLRIHTLMDNFLKPWGRDFLTEGIVDFGNEGTVMHYTSARDLGIITDGIIQNSSDWLRREADVAADSMTHQELAAMLSSVTGLDIGHRTADWDEYTGPPYLLYVFKWLDESGHGTDVEQLRQEFPEMTTLEQFLRDNGFADASKMLEAQSKLTDCEWNEWGEKFAAAHQAGETMNDYPCYQAQNDSLEKANELWRQAVDALDAQYGRVGFKIAGTAEQFQKVFKLGRPSFSIMYEGALLANGTEFDLSDMQPSILEADLGVFVKDGGINQAASHLEILEHLDFVAGYIEVPGIVYDTAPNPPTGFMLVASNALMGYGVVGDRVPVEATQAFADRLSSFSIVMMDATGEKLKDSNGMGLEMHPLDIVKVAVDRAKEFGTPAKAGDFISLGAFDGPTSIQPGMSVEVTYEGLADPAPRVGASFR